MEKGERSNREGERREKQEGGRIQRGSKRV
jgi:hypothetical protein